MEIQKRLKAAIFSLDGKMASGLLSATREKDTLLCFLFHGLFESGEELRSGVLDPQQGITVEMFRAFLGHFQGQGYRIVSPRQILTGPPTGGKYLLLTFDDGYFNNLRALPVMEEFNAPAVFFISSNHVREGKAFWWDVVFREGQKRGRTEEEIRRAVAEYKRWKTEEVEFDLINQFGKDALLPVGDLDRPFTPIELREFAGHRLVFLGNHTKDHAVLTNYRLAEVREQIQGGQDAIEQMTGKVPQMISYPNGNCSPQIEKTARETGLPLGVVGGGGRNRLPLKIGTPEAMTLKRFILWGDRGIEAQCRVSRANFSFYRLLESLKVRASVPLRFSPEN
jgi:peptidoglycan/xylan/chitin deacetylase (PgdA/CDA1 family)